MINETLSMAPFMTKQETLQDMAKTMALIPDYFGKGLTMNQKLYILDLLMRHRDNSDNVVAAEFAAKSQQEIGHELGNLHGIADALRSLATAAYTIGGV